MTPNVKTRADRARFYGSTTWRKLRQQCLERDNYECQWCKYEGKLTTQYDSVLEVDHIKELEKYPKYALDINNLRTLCKDCHNKRHDRMNYRGEQKKRKWDDEWW
ncbi:hypothetical protein IGI37_000091 [Enterococcus sp. AZ194]|uniref:HNH endonuclease n=1 Tax=Enterococcus sp. AZ194 TaxID=2774629 RepID=UPI003F246DAF